ncbi:ScbR family autoregulator-binding transcription factor [Streptomyces syringium]|uniref:ScbR family autoregulator-binding transcription factor n=1 Tax=Streptomyces syringium TaxID=76729 RepID=UPI0036AC1435
MAKQERAERTRGALLTAAADVFDHVGYERASLNAISEAAGVTKGALSFHFATKAELARAVQSTACSSSRAALTALDHAHPPTLQTVIDMTHVLAHLLEHHVVVRAGIRLSRELDYAPDASYDCTVLWRELLEDVLRRAEDDQALAPGHDPRTLTALALTMATGTELLVRTPPGPDAPCSADGPRDTGRDWLAQFWQLVLPGVAAPGPLRPTGTLGPCRVPASPYDLPRADTR